MCGFRDQDNNDSNGSGKSRKSNKYSHNLADIIPSTNHGPPLGVSVFIIMYGYPEMLNKFKATFAVVGGGGRGGGGWWWCNSGTSWYNRHACA